jgi:hypothetical protein
VDWLAAADGSLPVGRHERVTDPSVVRWADLPVAHLLGCTAAGVTAVTAGSCRGCFARVLRAGLGDRVGRPAPSTPPVASELGEPRPSPGGERPGCAASTAASHSQRWSGASGGVAPGQGVCDPQHRVAGRSRRPSPRRPRTARAAERMNHMWAHGSGIDRYLCFIRPVGGGGPGPLCPDPRRAFRAGSAISAGPGWRTEGQERRPADRPP